MEAPSKETWSNWLRHPTTQFFIRALDTKREFLKEGMAQGKAGAGVELQLFIGRCMGIEDCLNYASIDFEYSGKKEETENDDQSSGIPASS